MGSEAEVRVLCHAVSSVLFVATSSSGSSGTYTEVLEESDDVSDADYQKEMKNTAREAENFDYVLIEDSEFGEAVAEYVRKNVDDVEIDRFHADDYGTGTSASAVNTPSQLTTEYESDDYTFNPHKGRRKQREKDEKLRKETWGPLMNAASSYIRWQEDESDYIAGEDAGKTEEAGTENTYTDTSFINVGGTEQDESVEEEFMTTAGKTWKKVEESGKTQYVEDGKPLIDYGADPNTVEQQKQSAQHKYAGASANKLPGEDKSVDEKMGEYSDLAEKVEYAREHGKSSLVVTRKDYEDGVLDELDSSGLPYTQKDALNG